MCRKKRKKVNPVRVKDFIQNLLREIVLWQKAIFLRRFWVARTKWRNLLEGMSKSLFVFLKKWYTKGRENRRDKIKEKLLKIRSGADE